MPFWRVAEVHRQGSAENDERLFLEAVAVAAPGRAWFIAPNICPCVLKTGDIAEFGDGTCRLLRLAWPGYPLAGAWVDDAEAHPSSLSGVKLAACT